MLQSKVESVKSKVGSTKDGLPTANRPSFLANLLKKRRNEIPIQCGVGMKGAVLQKGLKMKLSINQGPYVGNQDVGFKVTAKHCRQLSCFVWDWSESLPWEVLRHIKVFTINPTLIQGLPGIEIKVIMEGSYPYSRGGVPRFWKTQFEETIFSYASREENVLQKTSKLEKTLSDKLLWALEAEQRTYQPLQEHFSFLVNLMKK